MVATQLKSTNLLLIKESQTAHVNNILPSTSLIVSALITICAKTASPQFLRLMTTDLVVVVLSLTANTM